MNKERREEAQERIMQMYGDGSGDPYIALSNVFKEVSEVYTHIYGGLPGSSRATTTTLAQITHKMLLTTIHNDLELLHRDLESVRNETRAQTKLTIELLTMMLKEQMKLFTHLSDLLQKGP